MAWGSNDYPNRGGTCGNEGICGCAIRECTDFCMWRMTHDLGYHCTGCPGDAWAWAGYFRARGVAVDGNVRLHDIACFPGGVQGADRPSGHVAMVLAVLGGGRWVAEQYNYDISCGYTNTVQFSSTGVSFIHLGTTVQPPHPTGCTPPCAGCQTCDGTACIGGCAGGAVCSGGECVCPPGQEWTGSVCATPKAPPPGVAATSDALLTALLLASGGLAWYEGRRHRSELASILHDRQTGFGGRREHLSLPRIHLPAFSSRPTRTRAGFGS